MLVHEKQWFLIKERRTRISSIAIETSGSGWWQSWVFVCRILMMCFVLSNKGTSPLRARLARCQYNTDWFQAAPYSTPSVERGWNFQWLDSCASDDWLLGRFSLEMFERACSACFSFDNSIGPRKSYLSVACENLTRSEVFERVIATVFY